MPEDQKTFVLKGLRMPRFGIYAYDEATNTVSYSDGGAVGKGVAYTVEPQQSDSSNFYADDGAQETEKGRFNGADLSLTTSGLSDTLSRKLLNLRTKTMTVGEKQVSYNVTDDVTTPPTIGFGIIEWYQDSGIDYYRAVILLKCFFNIPGNAANTHGESVEWQAKEIAGKIERSDAYEDVAGKGRVHPWKYEATFDTDQDALAFIDAVLNIDAEVPVG